MSVRICTRKACEELVIVCCRDHDLRVDRGIGVDADGFEKGALVQAVIGLGNDLVNEKRRDLAHEQRYIMKTEIGPELVTPAYGWSYLREILRRARLAEPVINVGCRSREKKAPLEAGLWLACIRMMPSRPYLDRPYDLQTSAPSSLP